MKELTSQQKLRFAARLGSRCSFVRRATVAVGGLLASAVTPCAAAEPITPAIAIIVHPQNTAPDPTLEELRALFTLERQFWPNGHRVVLLLPAANSAEKTTNCSRGRAISSDAPGGMPGCPWQKGTKPQRTWVKPFGWLLGFRPM